MPTEEQVARIRELLAKGWSKSRIAKELRVDRSTLYRWIEEMGGGTGIGHVTHTEGKSALDAFRTRMTVVELEEAVNDLREQAETWESDEDLERAEEIARGAFVRQCQEAVQIMPTLELNDAKALVRDLENRFHALTGARSAREALKEENADMRAELRQGAGEVDAISRKLQSCRRDLDEVKAETTRHCTERDNLRRELKDLRELTDLQAVIARTREERDVLLKDTTELRALGERQTLLVDLGRRAKAAQEQIAADTARLEALRTELRLADLTVWEKKRELARLGKVGAAAVVLAQPGNKAVKLLVADGLLS